MVLFAQEKEVMQYGIQVDYMLTYYPDSNTSDFKIEEMELLLNDKNSLFRAKKKGIMDSASYDVKQGISNGLSRSFIQDNLTNIKYQISKKGNDILTQDEYNLKPDQYLYYIETKDIFSWDIKQDTATIANMMCQKAELDFGGRHWVAWFTMEIPISDGPYKFCGLPGLILSIYDSKNYWKFDFIALANVKRDVVLNYDSQKVPHLIEKKDFFKEKRYYIDNKMQIEEASGLISFPDEKSRALSYKVAKERAQKDNNWIELYNPKE